MDYHSPAGKQDLATGGRESLRCFKGARVTTYIDGKLGWVLVGRYALDGAIPRLLKDDGGDGN